MPDVMHPPHLQPPAQTKDRRWTWATAALGAVAVVLALFELFDVGAVVATVAVVAGAGAMLISRTRGERFEIVTATVAAAVALAVCLAYGSGFSV